MSQYNTTLVMIIGVILALIIGIFAFLLPLGETEPPSATPPSVNTYIDDIDWVNNINACKLKSIEPSRSVRFENGNVMKSPVIFTYTCHVSKQNYCLIASSPDWAVPVLLACNSNIGND